MFEKEKSIHANKLNVANYQFIDVVHIDKMFVRRLLGALIVARVVVSGYHLRREIAEAAIGKRILILGNPASIMDAALILSHRSEKPVTPIAVSSSGRSEDDEGLLSGLVQSRYEDHLAHVRRTTAFLEETTGRTPSPGKLYEEHSHFIICDDPADRALISNESMPVGLRIDGRTDPGPLVRMLNPRREPGRLVMICRMGHGVIPLRLPKLVRSLLDEPPMVWCIEPIHHDDEMRRDILEFFRVARSCHIQPGVCLNTTRARTIETAFLLSDLY